LLDFSSVDSGRRRINLSVGSFTTMRSSCRT
jgi:hypothetical protein